MSINTEAFKVETGYELRLSGLIKWLCDVNFERTDRVTTFGQFSVVGDRIKIYPINNRWPLVIDLLGEKVESITILSSPKPKRVSSFTLNPNFLDADGLRFLPGQYVVHLDHGIGLFKGLGLHRRLDESDNNPNPYQTDSLNLLQSTDDKWDPYLIIEYADGAELFVPPKYSDKITHYIGSRRPVLAKLGSSRWQATKKHVEESLFKLAKELLDVAAKRKKFHRQIYNYSSSWLEMVDRGFPYLPTDDQQKAIDDVLNDLSADYPMDRLICGDVGFGKTEVAIRAATAVISCGKQVVMLCPTTLLAQQHFATFSERLSELPINIAILSRLVPGSEQDETKQKINQGKVDLIIGTHGLLRDDIIYPNLGLLIIDEEQRFGVKDKEHLKKIKIGIDILTLSATPIPRTLFSSLSGLRTISLIQTPPKRRKPIVTEVRLFNSAEMIQLIDREVKRGGQVIVLHNRVSNIQMRTMQLKKALPNLAIDYAHGQMPESRLSAVMSKMIHHGLDCLVVSSIIENGIDLPLANTLIVEEADRFGLADLYQLRGRVGRGDRQAYAYFFYSDKELTKAARQRFKVLTDLTDLGSGYSVALHDMEIRGGGNVLGREQHGNMEAVGLSLYVKLLDFATKKLSAGSFETGK